MKTINSSHWSGRCAGFLLGIWLSICFTGYPARGITFIYTGESAFPGNWFDVTNWNPHLVPSASDTIIVPTGVINVPNWSFADLRLTGGTIQGDFTVGGTLQWGAGTLSSGTITVSSGAVVNLGFASAQILNGVMVNHGKIIWPTGSYPVWVFNNGTLENAADGLLDMQVDGQFHRYSSEVVAQINNAGVIRKSAGAGAGFFNTGVGLNNTGLFDVQSGTMQFLDGFTSTGTFNVTNGAVLQLGSGTFHLQPGHQFTGGGFYGVLSGTVTVDGPITDPNFQFNNGTLIITNQLTGTMHWRNGVLAGELTVATNGVLDLPFQAAGTLAGLLTNHGLIVWPTGGYAAWVYSNGRLENATDGLLDMQVDGQFHRYSSEVVAQINNAGVIRKSAGAGAGFFNTGVGLNNTGLFDVQSGTVQFLDGFTSTGTFNVTNGAVLQLGSGTFHLQPGHQFTGGGFYGVLSGTVTVDGPITDPNFQFNNGTLIITNQLTGTMHWRNGVLAGELTVATNGVLEMSFQAAGTLTGVLTNHGTIVWPAGSYAAWVFNNGTVANMADGLLDIQVDGQFHRYSSEVVAQINNAGVIHKSAGTGTGFFNTGVGLSNTGLFDVRSGSTQFRDGFTSSGVFNVTNGAVLELNAGTFHLQPGHHFTGGGFYGVQSGTVMIDGPITEPNFQLNNGMLIITNQLTGTMHWRNGVLAGELTVATNGVLHMPFQSAGMLAGALTNHGTIVWPTGGYAAWVFNNGTLENMPDGLFDLQVDGQFVRNTSEVFAQINNAGVIRKSGDGGTAYFNTGVGLKNTGLLDVQNGTFQLPGDSLLAGGRVNCGLASASDYGHIAFPGAAVLNGALSADLIGGFAPAPGAQFQVISSGGLGGGFTSLNLPNHFLETNNANSVFLAVGDGGPVSFVGSAVTGTNFTCSFQTEAGQSYTVEYNDDLGRTNWEAYYTLSGDGSIVQCSMPMAGMPQCFFRVRQP